MIKVSVIIAVYNAERYLTECLDSVLAQTLDPIEVICIDDGSTDSSGAILNEYRINNSSMVVITQNNQGTGNAKNTGIKNANGEYLCFMDPDDFYPDKSCLELLYTTAKREKVKICGGSLYEICYGKIIKSDNMIFRNFGKQIYSETQILYGHTRFIYNTKMIKDNNIVCLPYRRYEEQVFFVRAMQEARYYFTIKKCVYIYRTGHKKLSPSRGDVVGILDGVKETLLLAEKYQYILLYKKYLRNFLKDYYKFYHRYLESDKDVDKAVQSIVNIQERWLGDTDIELWNLDKLNKYNDLCKREIERIRGIDCKKKIILYGAGRMGKWILDTFFKENENLIGFAVTEFTNEDYESSRHISNIPIKIIDSYLDLRDDVKVIITIADEGVQNIIHEKLRTLGFQDVEKLNFEKISYRLNLEEVELYD